MAERHWVGSYMGYPEGVLENIWEGHNGLVPKLVSSGTTVDTLLLCFLTEAQVMFVLWVGTKYKWQSNTTFSNIQESEYSPVIERPQINRCWIDFFFKMDKTEKKSGELSSIFLSEDLK